MNPHLMSLNPKHLDAVLEVINRAPFFRHMSMRVVELDTGHSKVVAKIEKKHMNPFGGLHGGVFSALIDTAAYWAAYCDLLENQGLVTIDLKLDLLAPVFGKDVVVTGKRIKSGKTLFLTEAQMLDDNGRVLAHGTSKLLVTNNKQTMHDAVDYLAASALPDKFMRSSNGV